AAALPARRRARARARRRVAEALVAALSPAAPAVRRRPRAADLGARLPHARGPRGGNGQRRGRRAPVLPPRFRLRRDRQRDSAPATDAEYSAINVASPNTPGLRGVQDADAIGALVAAVARAREELAADSGRRVPLLVKVSPDEPDERIDALADAALAAGADGL